MKRITGLLVFNLLFMLSVTAVASELKIRVYERGAGETLACGTGACAAVAVGRQWGKLSDHVEVELTGGALTIEWPGPGSPVLMTGPATHVFDGEIKLTDAP